MSERDRAAEEIAESRPSEEAGEGEQAPPDLEARLERAEAAAGEFRDQFLRTAAELENVRRRATRDVENAHRFGVERLARELLAVLDSMEMGRDASRGDGEDNAVAEGFDATLRLLQTVLEKFGVTPLEAEGQPFDPQAHEAIMTQPSDKAPPDTVLAVVQRGYRIHDRLLRPARVIVARPPAAEPPPGP
jgi:molecular chaperone GrpE